MYQFKKQTWLTAMLLLTLTACGGTTTPTAPVTPNSDATLSNLSFSNGTISPAFQAVTTSYTLSVAADSTTTVVTPTATETNATITVNGETIASGDPIATNLQISKTFTVIVTAANGTTTRTYTVNVISTSVTPNSDPTLSNLSFSGGTISPAFQAGTTSYTLSVAGGIVSTTVTPTTTESNATITVNGSDVTSGADSASIALPTTNTSITVIVTAVDGTTTQTYTVNVTRPSVSGELLDPTPGPSNRFGIAIKILGNGNIVVVDTGDSTFGSSSGAVHLYQANTNMFITSIYGDNPGDQLGSGNITALGNNNYVILSISDDINGINVGSARLVDGNTGVQIGLPIVGDQAGDLGTTTTVTALSNNNFVLAAQFDDDGATANTGAVSLFNGSTGLQIGNTLKGDTALDRLGSRGITALGNSNYVIASPLDDNGAFRNAGSVILVNGTTGAQIIALRGIRESDNYGQTSNASGITALANNNFVLAASDYDHLGVKDQLIRGRYPFTIKEH
jgi:hypothetical protein